MANASVNLVSLDFDTMKSSFVNYLKSQDRFKDYNFDNSNMSVLLDILSYNTYKNAFYLNMIHNEGFLDSARTKGSVYSHAKELNYLPRSHRSSVANVTLSFTATGQTQPYVVTKGSSFTTSVNQSTYNFVTDTDHIFVSDTVDPANNQQLIFSKTIDIYEGFYVAESYVMDYSNENLKFAINNEKIDTDSLTVEVYENNETVPKYYSLTSSLLNLDSTSKVFFLQKNTDSKYEVLFGDGVLGNKPLNGSLIVLRYRTCNGSEGNGAKQFTAAFNPNQSELRSRIKVTTNPFAAGMVDGYSTNGADAETIEDIKFYAPRYFQTQERAVTSGDYEILLKNKFPEISNISAYGGETLNPPRYGKVVIAVDISNVDGLPESKKNEYYSYIKTRSPLTVEPIFVEPQYTYARIEANIDYNISVTKKTKDEIASSVSNTILSYANINLQTFKSTLYYSKLVSLIDNVDVSIISNRTDLYAYKKVKPLTDNAIQNLVFDFAFPLKETYYILEKLNKSGIEESDVEVAHSVRSSMFTFNGRKCELEDDGNGIIRMVTKSDGQHQVLKNVGTVDYKMGLVKLNGFQLTSYDGSYFKIYVSPKNKDVVSDKNEILFIEGDEIVITTNAVLK